MPGGTKNQQLVSTSRQCSSTVVGFGQGFLSKEQCDSTAASLIFSWTGSSWFLPVPSMALLWCYWHNKECDGSTERLSHNGFQECFQHLYSRCKKFIVAQADYFHGNVAYMMYCFVFLRNKVIPGTFGSYHIHYSGK